ncbi:MAG: hypothetical protein HZA89_03825, partial [Verrucomicrobia bacterium]|nr:hypothetical protein [Verrucomicrobiota bacterium]
LKLTDQAMSYDGSATKRATVEVRNNPVAKTTSSTPLAADWPKHSNGSPDFEKMTSKQSAAYHVARLNRRYE